MKCTYCGGTEFFEGPSGGMSTNVLCANSKCRHWFNYSPVGLDDLHLVESTEEEKERESQAREETRRQEKLARFAEGVAAYEAGADPQMLRKDGAYGGYAESASNIDRLVGYLRALSSKKPT